MTTVVRKTIARETALEGTGLHSGATVRLRLRPAAPGTGMVFQRTDLPDAPRVSTADVQADGLPLRTALKRGPAEVHTIEHLLAACAGLGLTDLEVGLDGPEIPGMDGSALPFAMALHEAGIVNAGGEVAVVSIRGELSVADGSASITAAPHGGFVVTYLLDYPGEPLAQGTRTFELSEAAFLSEIAPARTFCMKKEAEQLRAAGFGKGANTANTLVLDGNRVLDNAFRFPDEPVRHKILDLLGDLYLLARPVQARLNASRSGHKLNRALAAKLGGAASGA